MEAKRRASRFNRLLRAAEAAVAAYKSGRIGTAMLDLEETVERLSVEPQPMPKGAMLNDPDYFRKIGARGGRIGGRANGASKARSTEVAARAGALGGQAKARANRHAEPGQRRRYGQQVTCPGCKHHQRITTYCKRVAGEVAGKPASWAVCDRCQTPLGPHVYDEDLEV